jgi:hypothetical protein
VVKAAKCSVLKLNIKREGKPTGERERERERKREREQGKKEIRKHSQS